MTNSPLLVVFDIDGTLTVSGAVHQFAFQQALEQFFATGINTDWGSYKHFSDSWIFQENYERFTGRFAERDEFDRFEKLFEQKFLAALGETEVKALPGAAQCLAELSACGIPYCFATGSLRLAAELKLACFPNICTRTVLSTASEAETRQDIVSLAVQKARAHHGIESFERIVSIGDGVWDYHTAKSLNYEFLGIGEGEGATKLQAVGAEHVMANFEDLAWMSYLLK